MVTLAYHQSMLHKIKMTETDLLVYFIYLFFFALHIEKSFLTHIVNHVLFAINIHILWVILIKF